MAGADAEQVVPTSRAGCPEATSSHHGTRVVGDAPGVKHRGRVHGVERRQLVEQLSPASRPLPATQVLVDRGARPHWNAGPPPPAPAERRAPGAGGGGRAHRRPTGAQPVRGARGRRPPRGARPCLRPPPRPQPTSSRTARPVPPRDPKHPPPPGAGAERKPPPPPAQPPPAGAPHPGAKSEGDSLDRDPRDLAPCSTRHKAVASYGHAATEPEIHVGMERKGGPRDPEGNAQW